MQVRSISFAGTLLVLTSAIALAQPPAPELRFTDPTMQSRLAVPYQAALDNLLRINTIPYTTGGKAAEYNQTGLLAKTPDTFIRAGGGYEQPWTRDASVNSWNAASLLEPAAARNTLLAVLKRQPDGKLIVQQDNQWWDQTIWVVSAWNHYLVTGDRAFLRNAYQAAAQTLSREKQAHWNAAHGLFEGPAFLNDGIAGYPAPPADAEESRGSFVLAYPGADKLMPLSTNCIYVGAYRAAAAMAGALGRPPGEAQAFTAQADTLAEQIRKQFWVPAKGRFGYLLHPDGTLDTSQEGAGLAFSILFGVATPEQTASIVRSIAIAPRGLVDVAPAFPRFSAEHPGRHNVIVWPPIEAFWAEAAARSGDTGAFAHETEALAGLALGSGGKFWEIYNADTGKPDGGWQVGHQWDSQPNQTWSATGYLRMIYAGLFGMRFAPDGLRLEPTLPPGWGAVALSGLHYRGAVLQIQLLGAGRMVRSFMLDGVKQQRPVVPAGLRGAHTVEVELGS